MPYQNDLPQFVKNKRFNSPNIFQWQNRKIQCVQRSQDCLSYLLKWDFSENNSNANFGSKFGVNSIALKIEKANGESFQGREEKCETFFEIIFRKLVPSLCQHL